MAEHEASKHGAVRPLYAVTIHQCIAQNDLGAMKKLSAEAEQHVKDHGNVSAALEALKIEIAKLEGKK